MHENRFSELFHKLLNRTATAEDKKELRHLWNKEAGNPDPDQLFPYQDWLQTNSDELLPEALQQKTLHYIFSREASGKTVPLSKRYFFLRWFPAAAAILVCVITGFWLLHSQIDSPVAQVTIVAAYGETKTITLPDSSIVHLNAGSTVQFPEHFNKNQRNISLKGEAFFEISHDPASPFIVQTGRITTTVLGTSFNVTAWAEETGATVSVRTGKVKVAVTSHPGAGREEIQLLPGMQAVYRAQQGQGHRLEVAHIRPEDAGSWKENRLVFDNVSLKEICQVLQRKHAVRFAPIAPGLLQCRYSITLNGLTLQQSLDKLSMLGGLHFSRADSSIAINGKPCIH